MKLHYSICLLLFIAASCSPGPRKAEDLLSVNLREQMDHPSRLTLQDEIESVEYIPLETTGDPSSLLDGVLEYAVTKNYIYVSPVKEQRIVLFDRQGHFIKTLIPFGQGPGELVGPLLGMQADEKQDRLYLFCGSHIGVYTLDGAFVCNLLHDYPVIYQRMVGPGRFASVAFPYVPFQSGSYGLGVFTAEGDTIVTKNDFSSSLVPPEKAGFTIGMAMGYSGYENSLLFKTGSNDTLFRMTADKIQPACVLQLQNSDNEVIRALDATDFSSLRKKIGEEQDIFISDLFETSRSYYLRCRYKGGHFVASIDKKTGKVCTEQCVQPGDLKKLSDANLLFGMLGTRSYHGFPIWGRTERKVLVQAVTPYELSLYAEAPDVIIPRELKDINEDSNPVFIIYKLRED